MGIGAAAADAGRHQDRSGQHGCRFEASVFVRNVQRFLGATHQRVQCHLLDDKASIVPSIVNVIGVPLSKVIVGTFVGGVVKVVSPWIKRQFIQ